MLKKNDTWKAIGWIGALFVIFGYYLNANQYSLSWIILDTWKPYGWHVFTYKKGVLYCNYVFYYHTNEYLRIYKMDAMKIDFLNI